MVFLLKSVSKLKLQAVCLMVSLRNQLGLLSLKMESLFQASYQGFLRSLTLLIYFKGGMLVFIIKRICYDQALKIKGHAFSRVGKQTFRQIERLNDTLKSIDVAMMVDENCFLVGKQNTHNRFFPKIVLLEDSVVEGALTRREMKPLPDLLMSIYI